MLRGRSPAMAVKRWRSLVCVCVASIPPRPSRGGSPTGPQPLASRLDGALARVSDQRPAPRGVTRLPLLGGASRTGLMPVARRGVHQGCLLCPPGRIGARRRPRRATAASRSAFVLDRRVADHVIRCLCGDHMSCSTRCSDSPTRSSTCRSRDLATGRSFRRGTVACGRGVSRSCPGRNIPPGRGRRRISMPPGSCAMMRRPSSATAPVLHLVRLAASAATARRSRFALHSGQRDVGVALVAYRAARTPQTVAPDAPGDHRDVPCRRHREDRARPPPGCSSCTMAAMPRSAPHSSRSSPGLDPRGLIDHAAEGSGIYYAKTGNDAGGRVTSFAGITVGPSVDGEGEPIVELSPSAGGDRFVLTIVIFPPRLRSASMPVWLRTLPSSQPDRPCFEIHLNNPQGLPPTTNGATAWFGLAAERLHRPAPPGATVRPRSWPDRRRPAVQSEFFAQPRSSRIRLAVADATGQLHVLAWWSSRGPCRSEGAGPIIHNALEPFVRRHAGDRDRVCPRSARPGRGPGPQCSTGVWLTTTLRNACATRHRSPVRDVQVADHGSMPP